MYKLNEYKLNELQKLWSQSDLAHAVDTGTVDELKIFKVIKLYWINYFHDLGFLSLYSNCRMDSGDVSVRQCIVRTLVKVKSKKLYRNISST